MRLDLPACRLDALRQSRHLEHGLLIATRSHDVRVSLVLYALDGGALGTDHQTYHAVRDPYLDGHVSGDVGGWAGRSACSGAQTRQIVFTGRPNLREMLGGRQNLTFRLGDVLLPSGHDEDGLLPAHRGFDVRVGLGAESFDLATCNKEIW